MPPKDSAKSTAQNKHGPEDADVDDGNNTSPFPLSKKKKKAPPPTSNTTPIPPPVLVKAHTGASKTYVSQCRPLPAF
jgi:hypothetical protein